MIKSEPDQPSAPFYRAPSRGASKHESISTLSLAVPEVYVGQIIGRGGATIRGIEQSTGTRIFIDPDRHRGYGDVHICILGSESQQRVAKDKVARLSGPLPRTKKTSLDSSASGKSKGLEPIIKEFYVAHPDVAGMSSQEVENFRKINNNISVKNVTEKTKNRPIPNPIRTFNEAFKSYPDIMAEKPTPIQCQAWPIIMQGIDLIGVAQTDKGKTLSFLLPAFIHIEGQVTPRPQREGPTVLILSPTRELAFEIESEVRKYKYKGIKCVCVYGGIQIDVVPQGFEIVIATPDRLNELLTSGGLSVRSVTYLVLEEADRMLNLGFEPQIRKIIANIRDDRQTIMTSTTWSPGVRRMTDMYLTDPVQVIVGSLNLPEPVHAVTQLVEIISEDEKRERVSTFISEMSENDKVIVFVRQKATADDVASNLSLRGYRIECIHDIDCEQALEDFKKGYVKVLIVTDVASRRLDVKDVTAVINYDFPRNIEHPLVTSLTLMTREDWKRVQDLIEESLVVTEELFGMADRYKEEMRKWGRLFGHA
ncbi:probable ATP-dependent RNA helicase DDX43 isoform X2 [Oscarella lobularis]|uniref:probable ATP-dependent RNA helicase DDX43 isoform X2 n=1 Tax=Oscarella lobularis TaxID=121494 RepID=UPI0033134F15